MEYKKGERMSKWILQEWVRIGVGEEAGGKMDENA